MEDWEDWERLFVLSTLLSCTRSFQSRLDSGISVNISDEIEESILRVKDSKSIGLERICLETKVELSTIFSDDSVELLDAEDSVDSADSADLED